MCFSAINAGALALQEINFYLKGNTPVALGCRRTSTGHVGRDAINTQLILPLSEGDQINTAAAANTALSADAGKPTSWAIVNVNDIGSTLSVFSYAFNSPDSNPLNPLKFDVNVTDVNGGYDSNSGVFRPLFPGLYFLTMGVGVDTSSVANQVDYSMSCSGQCGAGFVSTKITRTHTNYQGFDSLSRGVIVNIPVGAEITVSSANPFWSSAALQTSFSGFYYQPDIAQNE